MKYLKLFEAWVEEPIFLRRSHYDLLAGEIEGQYQPVQRVRMIGSPVINQSLVSRGFPDKENCIHFMNRVASFYCLLKKILMNIPNIDDIIKASKLHPSRIFNIYLFGSLLYGTHEEEVSDYD
jgi:hypothetical protein